MAPGPPLPAVSHQYTLDTWPDWSGHREKSQEAPCKVRTRRLTLFHLDSNLDIHCPNNCWNPTHKHERRTCKKQSITAKEKTPKAKKWTLITSPSPEPGVLCQTQLQNFSYMSQENPFFFFLNQFGLGVLATWNTEGSEIHSWYRHYMSVSNREVLWWPLSQCDSALCIPGKEHHPLGFKQPHWCARTQVSTSWRTRAQSPRISFLLPQVQPVKGLYLRWHPCPSLLSDQWQRIKKKKVP